MIAAPPHFLPLLTLEAKMIEVTEEKIRALAYQLWERDGSPEGKDDEYWHAARELLADEGELGANDDQSIVPPVVPLPGADLR
jgi:hypothetical protein